MPENLGTDLRRLNAKISKKKFKISVNPYGTQTVELAYKWSQLKSVFDNVVNAAFLDGLNC